MDIEWGERVTKLARMVLNQRRYEETTELPAPEDVRYPAGYLVRQIKQQTANIKHLTPASFFRLIALLQARLMIYNKRRSGEIEVIK